MKVDCFSLLGGGYRAVWVVSGRGSGTICRGLGVEAFS